MVGCRLNSDTPNTRDGLRGAAAVAAAGQRLGRKAMKGKRILIAVLLAFAVSTTSVSCLPYCPMKGGPAVTC